MLIFLSKLASASSHLDFNSERQTTMPLLELPPEIFHAISSYAIKSYNLKEVICIEDNRYMEYLGLPLTNSQRHIFASQESIRKKISLFFASRRFYQDFSSIFYSTGNFYIYIVPVCHPQSVLSLAR